MNSIFIVQIVTHSAQTAPVCTQRDGSCLVDGSILVMAQSSPGADGLVECCDLIEELFFLAYMCAFTLFQMSTFEAWADICRAMMYYDSNLVWFFLAYMAISALGLINLVIGVIVEHTTVEGKTQDMELGREKGLKTLASISRLRDHLGADGVVTTAHVHAAKFDQEIQKIFA